MRRAVWTTWWLVACAGEVAPSGSGGPPPAPVEVAAVEAPELSGVWTVTGDVRPLQRARLSSQVAGRIDRVDVRVGDRVSLGDRLARVDPALAAAQRDAAEASLEEAEVEAKVAGRQLARLERLAEGVVSDSERDAAKGRLQGAQARVRSAEARVAELGVALERHVVRAPWDGVVSRRLVDPGDHAVVGTPILDLVATGGVEVLVDGPVDLLSAVTPGLEVTIGDDVAATVSGIVPALDPDTRTVRVRIVPDASDAALLPGAVTTVTLPYTRTDGSVVVPQDALVRDPSGTTVVKLDGDGHARVSVEVLATHDGRALVRTDGLVLDDRVVIKGNERLRPGQPIRVVTRDGSDTP